MVLPLCGACSVPAGVLSMPVRSIEGLLVENGQVFMNLCSHIRPIDALEGSQKPQTFSCPVVEPQGNS